MPKRPKPPVCSIPHWSLKKLVKLRYRLRASHGLRMRQWRPMRTRRSSAKRTPNAEHLDLIGRRKIIRLAGVAPLARDSGKYQGKRVVRGGRASVRDLLFIVASVVGR